MTDQTTVVFLGINDAGMRVYEWLCSREDVFVHSLLTTKAQLRTVETIRPDYLVSCGYSHIVPETVLEMPTEYCLNLHPSLLPFNRGANPNVWSIVDETPAGVTLHSMDAGIDTGRILAQRKVEKQFSDTGKTRQKRREDSQVALFKETWPDVVAGNISGDEQAEDTGTYHRTEEFETLCRLDPDQEVRIKEFLDRLRALTYPPYDNARIEVDGETYYIEVDITRA
jgi:methionyl-tRNA formyltransferase